MAVLQAHPLSSPPLSIRRLEVRGKDLDAAPHQLSPVSDDGLDGGGPGSPSLLARHAPSAESLTARKLEFAADIAGSAVLGRGLRAGSGAASPRAQPSFEPLQRGDDLDRQAAVLDLLAADAREESALSAAQATALARRLAGARSGAERTLGVLRALAGAEAELARAMTAAAAVGLAAEGDGAGMRAALAAFQELPLAAAAAHEQVAACLARGAAQLQTLVARLRGAATDATAGAARLKRGVDEARRAMAAACAAHRAAGAAGAGAAGRGAADDPWITEARLVRRQAALMTAQHEERQYVLRVGRAVEELERSRAATLAEVLGSAVQTYSTSLVAVAREGPRLVALLESTDPEGDLAPLLDAAQRGAAAGEALAARQAEALAGIVRHLAASPEVLRAGVMEAWDAGSGTWVAARYVLTRAGCLHRMPRQSGREVGDRAPRPTLPTSAAAPEETLALGRCAFEQGEAPTFRLVETPAGGLARHLFRAPRTRAHTFRAASVEECMDWAIAVRDAIAECTR